MYHKVLHPFHKLITIVKLKGNNVSYKAFDTTGIPYIMVARGGNMSIGNGFSMHNDCSGNPIGCFQPCSFVVDSGAKLTIGDNVGISQSALVAIADITIGNNVKIGGGTYIYTSDFHSLDPAVRASKKDKEQRHSAPVVIQDNVFIGAHCIILKGVEIGENSIIGAGSVLTKDVPPNQIWAGNPAKFIKSI